MKDELKYWGGKFHLRQTTYYYACIETDRRGEKKLNFILSKCV